MNGNDFSGFGENHLNNNNIPIAHMDYTFQNMPKKRKMDENPAMDSAVFPLTCGKRFIPVRKNSSVYMTEDWKPTGTSLFQPVMQDLFINTDKYDQLSITEGNFFVADNMGKYCKSVAGKVLHLWRYNKTEKCLFVAMSLLYTCPQEFCVLQSLLNVL